jgi:hypothetical protein
LQLGRLAGLAQYVSGRCPQEVEMAMRSVNLGGPPIRLEELQGLPPAVTANGR